jgi:hypothetical protein
MKKLAAMAGISITTGTTYDNAKHLSPDTPDWPLNDYPR